MNLDPNQLSLVLTSMCGSKKTSKPIRAEISMF